MYGLELPWAIPDEVLEIELGRKIHDHQRHCQVKLAQGIRAYHRSSWTKPLNASGKQLRRQKTQRLPILIQVPSTRGCAQRRCDGSCKRVHLEPQPDTDLR